jgi:hypothetical protein
MVREPYGIPLNWPDAPFRKPAVRGEKLGALVGIELLQVIVEKIDTSKFCVGCIEFHCKKS